MSEAGSSRCRWLGPTPEMVAWWVRGTCPLIQHFAQAFPAPTTAGAMLQMCRPLHEVHKAETEGRRDGDLVFLLPDDDRSPGTTRDGVIAFFVSEHLESMGGQPAVPSACLNCQCNPQPRQWAGCCDLLVAGDLQELGRQSQILEHHPLPLAIPVWTDQVTIPSEMSDFAAAIEAGQGDDKKSGWYRWISRSTWTPTPQQVDIARHFRSHQSPSWQLQALIAAMELARNHEIHLQHIPRGFSDGHDWWIGPHCHHCHHPMAEHSRGCPHCRNDSGPVPSARRRVMGWHPYFPLEALVGRPQAKLLTEQWSQG